MQYPLLYILSFAISMICGFLFIPVVIDFCRRKKLYDLPDERKLHHNNTPRMGGIVFLPSCMIVFLAMLLVVVNSNNFEIKFQVDLPTIIFFFSLLIVYMTGLVDDIAGLKPITKFITQIIAASMLPLSGLFISDLHGFLGMHEISAYIGIPLTIFIIVFINNAMNLIDGIDGLAASLALIALGGFLWFFHYDNMNLSCMLIAGIMGVLVPFLRYNLWGSNTKGNKIFMGDSGSLTLGFILAFLVVKHLNVNSDIIPAELRPVNTMTLLIVPCLDVIRVTLVRLRQKSPIFGADKRHIHHKLLRCGYTQHQALSIILGLALLFIIVNYITAPYLSSTIILVIDLLLWLIFHKLTDSKIKAIETNK